MRIPVVEWLGIVISGMVGGQKSKPVRRFGIPSIAIWTAWSKGRGWRCLAFLLLIPTLCMGYGVDSVLGAVVGHTEWLIRLVYALLLSIPFYFFGKWRGILASVSLSIAFAIRAGSLGSIGGFDLLIEDLIRYGVLGLLVIFV